MVSAEGQQITHRFFEAVDALIAMKVIRGKKTISTALGIDNSSMYKIRNKPQIFALKPEFIRYLVLQYHVSANWIITGRGRMFTR